MIARLFGGPRDGDWCEVEGRELHVMMREGPWKGPLIKHRYIWLRPDILAYAGWEVWGEPRTS